MAVIFDYSTPKHQYQTNEPFKNNRVHFKTFKLSETLEKILKAYSLYQCSHPVPLLIIGCSHKKNQI